MKFVAVNIAGISDILGDMSDRLDFTETLLPNGIRIFSHKMDVPLFALHIMLPVGSAHSHERNVGGRNGIAHFLEHTVLKRSKRFPELQSFDRLVGSQGGYVNAFTGPFWTEFVAEAPVAAESEIVDGIISNIYEPVFREEDIMTERGVVSNERRQRKYYPGKTELGQYVNRDWIEDFYYPKEQSLGSDEDLASFTPEVLELFRKNYTTDKALVVASGGHDIGRIISAFSSIQTRPVKLVGECTPIGWKNRTYHEREFKELDHPILFLGGLQQSYDWDVDGILGFMGGLLCNPYNGPLYLWLRNEKGWTYGIHSRVGSGQDRLKWTLEIPMNDTATVPEIRREIYDRARTALSDPKLIQSTIDRSINRKVFRFQTAEGRADAATDMLADMGRIANESEMEVFTRSMDDTKRLLDTFDQYFSPDVVGEFLALPGQDKSM